MIPPPHTDDIYEEIEYRQFLTGTVRRGVVGWHEGPKQWVTLQVRDGPVASAQATTLASAYRFARLKLLLCGYVPSLGGASAPFT